jgi:uncharacterized paraquat-inducible protein A
MNFRRLLLLPLLAAALIVTTASEYTPGVSAQQKEEGSAHSKKPSQFYFVCPMHENVTSEQRGTCPKCKMTLVKKRKPRTPPST